MAYRLLEVLKKTSKFSQISFIKLNKVIVNNEMTEEYYVQDGIDQGEIWSPLSSYSAENAEKK
ncbi:hypothetical protein C1646_762717 [Rhizophagus diaphanus]|nr:hypothetical protein C1646_762717 [Rhizophagus diaphanus] [Rhizophagus sp. MUCL 43196]